MNVVLNMFSNCLKAFPFVREGWLFGSYANGTAGKHSDIDLCVVVDNGTFDNANYGAVLFEISRAVKFRYDIDLVMVEKSKVITERRREDLVYFDIFSKGKRFYFSEDL